MRSRVPGRIVFVGGATCGKTSLVRGLRAGKAAPTAGEDAPTNVLEVSSLSVGSDEELCEVSCWDLGGEIAYAPCQLGLLVSTQGLKAWTSDTPCSMLSAVAASPSLAASLCSDASDV